MKDDELSVQRKQLHGKKKLQYIWDYYKLPIAVACILIYIIGYIIYGHITKKDTLLHTALINVTVGEETTNMLSEDFLQAQHINKKKNEILLTTGLYLTDDEHSPYFEYTQASRIKILANIQNEELDIVLMDQEVFDAFTKEDYLYNLEELFSSSSLTASTNEGNGISKTNEINKTEETDETNKVSDNEKALSKIHNAILKDQPVGIDLSSSPLIKKAGFEDKIYLGIIKNSTRLDMAKNYILYLFS